ncbi:MAG: hypothetical protein H0V66_09695 [Bdellovibrionales bacterium]|nr:hypothetical protein [Bdellovibrionales bacterium]
MMLYLFMLLTNVLYADPAWKWSNAVKITEQHEFYKNNEIIIKPQNSWQTLFAVNYHDSNLKTFKDCIFYRVPGEEQGILKIKTIQAEQNCEEFLYQPGNQEWKNLKALQYSVERNMVSISLTNTKFQIEKWDVPLLNIFQHPKPKSLMSSAEYRAPKILHLTPYKGVLQVRPVKTTPLSNKKLCHDIADDCSERSASSCTQCAEGWYEITNGCKQGPKYCGSINCGTKNQPACRRGFKYQRTKSEFRCLEDASFAYCAKGLIIQCQGNSPYCI